MAAVCCGAWASADTVWIESGAGGSLEIPRVKITKIDDAAVYFATSSGTEGNRELERVLRLQIDNEPVFSAAEEAFASEKWEEATDGYLKTMRTATKDWMKSWSERRLLTAANKAKRFDAAVVAYIPLLLARPDEAIKSKPTPPTDKKSPQFTVAAQELSRALASGSLSTEQRTALLSMQLDVERARGNLDEAGKIGEELMKLNPNAANDPANAQAIAEARLSRARLALDTKNYPQALAEIKAGEPIFILPGQQADALYYRAEAQRGLLDQSPDDNALKDVALAFMRVVTVAKNLPDKRHMGEALLAAAQLMEQLKEPAVAAGLYAQAAEQLKGAQAEQAKAAAARLKPAEKTNP